MEAGPRDRERPGAPDGEDSRTQTPRLSPDGPELTEDGTQDVSPHEVEVELRPQRRLRIWQLAPIVGLGALGSLMFAFPLAFGSGDGGAVLAMLGLLLCGCTAGWGMMAARRVGYTWPGLPPGFRRAPRLARGRPVRRGGRPPGRPRRLARRPPPLTRSARRGPPAGRPASAAPAPYH